MCTGRGRGRQSKAGGAEPFLSSTKSFCVCVSSQGDIYSSPAASSPCTINGTSPSGHSHVLSICHDFVLLPRTSKHRSVNSLTSIRRKQRLHESKRRWPPRIFVGGCSTVQLRACAGRSRGCQKKTGGAEPPSNHVNSV